jgi:hypothetical protein
VARVPESPRKKSAGWCRIGAELTYLLDGGENVLADEGAFMTLARIGARVVMTRGRARRGGQATALITRSRTCPTGCVSDVASRWAAELRLAQGHATFDTAKVSRKPHGRIPGRRPLVDGELAGHLLDLLKECTVGCMSEPVSLLGFFLSAASAFGKLFGWLRDEDRKSRERVATYFDQIAACMREVAERIEAGDPPRDTCRRLAVYADELQKILGDRIALMTARDTSVEETRQRLIQQIRRTQQLWATAGEARIQQDLRSQLDALQRQEEAEATRTAKDVVQQVKIAATDRLHKKSSVAEIDRLADELEGEFASRIDIKGTVQEIWDASGEFAALADALRAQ